MVPSEVRTFNPLYDLHYTTCVHTLRIGITHLSEGRSRSPSHVCLSRGRRVGPDIIGYTSTKSRAQLSPEGIYREINCIYLLREVMNSSPLDG